MMNAHLNNLRSLWLVVMTVVTMLMLPTVAKAQSFTYEGLYYNVTNIFYAEVTSPPEGKYSGDITIPEKVKYNGSTGLVIAVGDNAFKGASGVTSVKLPLKGITKIGEYAFNDCTGLTEFTLPESITSIGKYAFYYCDKLQHLYVHSKDPSTYNVGTGAFSKINNGGNVCTLHVPKGCTAAYAADAAFSVFTKVEEFEPPVLYDLYVADKQVTSENASDILGDGAASYDAEKNTLTIKGNITSSGDFVPCIGNNSMTDLTIEVAKAATLTSDWVPINIFKDTKITGSSLLKLVPTTDVDAIFAEMANLEIVNANIEMEGGIGGYNQTTSLTITNSSLKIQSLNKGGVISDWKELILKDCYIKEPSEYVYDVCSKYNNRKCLMNDDGLETIVESAEICPGEPIIYYDLFVAVKQVTSENASDILGNGVASYDADKNTLTIKGDITCKGKKMSCIRNEGVANLTIEVAAPATLTSEMDVICLGESTKITGASLLKLVASDKNAAIYSMFADLMIENANLEIKGRIEEDASHGTLTITNSSVTAETQHSGGAIVWWSDLVLNGCTIKTPQGAKYGECSKIGNEKCIMDQNGDPAMTVIINTKEEPVKGDANNDGKVNADDIKAVVDYILTGKTAGFNFDNADLNGDKKVNAADLVLLIAH